tara:strand:+ start:360 stop:521 length:162 start_codon:yes stop_codon:yes gene_type:complete
VKKLFQFLKKIFMIFRARAHIASKTFSFPSLKTLIYRKICKNHRKIIPKTAVF